MTCNVKIFVSFLFLIISTTSFAHVAGVTDTGIHVNANSIDIIYTVPSDNINEFTEQEQNQLVDTIMKGFVVDNTISHKVDSNTEHCYADLVSQKTLENIKSKQFYIRYTCRNQLDNVSIIYTLFIPEFENHKNHVRLSIAGRSQSFTFSNTKTSHKLPIKKLITAWGVTLSDKNSIVKTSKKNLPEINDSETGFFDLLLQSKHYFLIGVEHILLGYDHVLFLIGLLLLPLGLRSIIIIATSFTLAHSITLTISVFELFTLPAPYVEALIALSIVYIAIENMRLLKGKKNLSIGDKNIIMTWQKRGSITFLFGLLHGFGFSYVLKEIGLGEHVLGSLLFFNLGVEFGQLLIIVLCFPLLWYMFKKSWGKNLAISLSLLIGLMGFFWLVERLFSLL